MSFELDYDNLILLDAEDLAEGGIGKAYEELLPELRKYVPQPAKIEELLDNETPRYSVKCGPIEFVVYAPELEGELGNLWGRATYAFFRIVNDQLTNSPYRLYAINGGNDLAGMFLTPDQAQESRLSLPKKSDLPYLPTNDPDGYGMYY